MLLYKMFEGHHRPSQIRLLLIMKLIIFLTILNVSVAFANSNAQTITLHARDMTLVNAMRSIQKQSGYAFFLKGKSLANLRQDVDIAQLSLSKAMTELLKNVSAEWTLENGTIVIKPITATKPKESLVALPNTIGVFEQQRTITGKVTDEDGNALQGASVKVKGASIGTHTDAKGNFKLDAVAGTTLEISYIGYEIREVVVKDLDHITIKLKLLDNAMTDLVITGIFDKTKQNFTGAAVTVKNDELRRVGALNLIQALSAFDPSIRLNESIRNGSNPNIIPDITIRGETGFDLRANVDDATSNPNAPLYILDGIEVSARYVFDMDINRVESATILKDASATALYGSRGANGVIVITTFRPKAGQIRVTFDANTNVSAPDLRDYNLMNATQKLEYEKRAGVYNSQVYTEQIKLDQLYNSRLEEVARGVNTYWLSQPLQTSVNQRYTLGFEGGDKSFKYGIGARYDKDRGVMKQSGRDRYGADFTFDYNIGKNFYIRNNFVIDNVTGYNTPYGNFQSYANQNPYDRIYDADGKIVKKLSTGDWNLLADVHLPKLDQTNYITMQDNLNVDWRIMKSLRLQGRIGYTKQIDKQDRFKSPASVSYTDELDPKKKGTYYLANNRSERVDGNLTLSYNTFFNSHSLNIGVGSNMLQSESKGESFTAMGFSNPDISFIGSALAYDESTKPGGNYDKSRLIGFFGNLNYGYDSRYFVDLSYRTDGSSKFGRNSRFAPFWSLGGAWNVHKENWWRAAPKNSLKFRASAGSTGTTNFSSAQALSTYITSFTNEYNNIYGVNLVGYGNPNLKWQNTISYNAGVDWTLLNGFITFYSDFYVKNTQNLLLPVNVAPSTGFRDYMENIGKLRNIGVEGRLRFNFINDNKKDIRWSMTLMAFRNKGKIIQLSDQLKTINGYANNDFENQGTVIYRNFAEGRSQTAIMLVRSAGIDPATGNEIYYKQDGSLTFDYDNNDKVLIGDMKPDIEGSINSNLTYKGFNLFMLFRYRYGGKAYNGTLATKVEGSSPKRNADLRVLEDRWKQPGDHVGFRRIDDASRPYQTSRLVFDDNLFSLQSISLSYDMPTNLIKKLWMTRARILISTTDLFRFSSIKQERGIAYPFAKTFNVGLNVSF